MGIFDALFGKGKKETPPPPRGPSTVAPDPLTTIPPYYPATRGYSYPPHGIDRSGRNRYHENPSDGDAWSRYHTTGQQEWQQVNDVRYSTPQPSYPREQLKADDPRWVATTPHRPTKAPSTYRAVQPFGQKTAPRLNGNHFSLAGDAKPSYPKRGMQPQTRTRTIWRVTPVPTNLRSVDSNPGATDVDDNAYRSPVLPLRNFARGLGKR